MTLFNDSRRKLAAATSEARLADRHQEADEAALSFPLLATRIPFPFDPEPGPFFPGDLPLKHSLPSVSESVILPQDFNELVEVGGSPDTVLGHNASGAPLTLNIGEIVGKHTLIQAMSGGGKSFALRKILEILHTSSMPFVVFDPEDEFATLKETFPEVIILGGTGGDVPVDTDTIGAVMLTLLETRASAVVQLRDFDQQEQRRIIAGSISALMQSPKALWAPLAIAIDEIQRFAPENGRCESTEAIADLMRQGRKRHFSGIMATQRFSQVSKACITQASNILAGRVTISTDISRAEAEFGLDKVQAASLRELKTGCFLARGPALSAELARITIAGTKSSHGSAEPVLSLLDRPRAPAAEVIERLRNIGAGFVVRPGEAGIVQQSRSWAKPDFPSAATARSQTEGAPIFTVHTGLSEPAERMLAALAADENGRLSRDVLGLLVQLSPSGATFARVFGEILNNGLATFGKTDVRLTADGKSLVETSLRHPATMSGYVAAIRKSLTPDARRLLDALIAASPAFIAPVDLATRTGMSPCSRKMKGLLAELVHCRLVRKSKGRFGASPAVAALMLG